MKLLPALSFISAFLLVGLPIAVSAQESQASPVDNGASASAAATEPGPAVPAGSLRGAAPARSLQVVPSWTGACYNNVPTGRGSDYTTVKTDCTYQFLGGCTWAPSCAQGAIEAYNLSKGFCNAFTTFLTSDHSGKCPVQYMCCKRALTP